MICDKCNHRIPDDSDFCQYCGYRIEKIAAVSTDAAVTEQQEVDPAVVAPGASATDEKQNIDNMTPEEVINAILSIQAQSTLDAMKANRQAQPDHEGDADFGLVPEKPIFTLAIKSVDGEKEYLEKLHTTSGEKIKYKRLGSTSADGISGIIDIYETYLPSGEYYKTIYINMYGAKSSTKAPAGFTIGIPIIKTTPTSMSQPEKPVDTPRSQNKKSGKIKYCSKCGSAIDNKTKKCTGCGKQYFRGLRFTKFSGAVTILVFVIIVLSTVCIFQYWNIQELGSTNRATITDLENKIIDLEQQVRNKETSITLREGTIENLQYEIEKLKQETADHSAGFSFFERYAEIIPDDGRKKYHKWGCPKLDTSHGFWIYNTEAVPDDYVFCLYCH